ncbi:MAG TPA: hypothetical protein VGE96_03460 [Steroidobacteraceae bacterium]
MASSPEATEESASKSCDPERALPQRQELRGLQRAMQPAQASKPKDVLPLAPASAQVKEAQEPVQEESQPLAQKPRQSKAMLQLAPDPLPRERAAPRAGPANPPCRE